MVKHILTLSFVIIAVFAKSQSLFLQNPSFEGSPQPHIVPAPWDNCFGGSADGQPGSWGINNPPADGGAYVSFLESGDGSYIEGVSQQLSGCFVAGQTYTATMYIAFSPTYNTAEPGGCYGSVCIRGSMSSCDVTGELLWTSGMITTPGWNQVTITVTPTQPYCWISISPYLISNCSGYINGMVDGMTPFVPSTPGIQITSPIANANAACDFLVTGTSDSLPNSVTLTGNFTGSPVTANILNATNWQTFVSYPDNLSGPQTIIAVGQFPNGVVKTDTVTFNLIDIVPNFTSTAVCVGSPTQFTDQSTITTPGTIANYLWTFEPGQTSGLQNPTYTFSQGGTYSVSLIVTSNAGCQDTIIKQVTVNPGPTANFNLNSGCLGVATAFNDLSTISGGGILTGWSWDFGDLSGTSTQQNPTYNYTAAGNYIVVLIVTSSNGCSDTIQRAITISPLPTAAFNALPLSGCAPLAVTFTDGSLGNGDVITTWAWDLDDGATASTANTSHVYLNPGSYDISLIITTQGNCKDTLSRPAYITANPQATAAFSVSPGVTDEIDRNITFTDLSANATGWAWDLGDGTLSNAQNLYYTYQDTGTFLITLVADNLFNCPDTAYGSVRINPVSSFYVPSAFTPNGDGLNDYFGGKGTNLRNYEMYIFDRWGQPIFSSIDMNIGWDGTYKKSGTVLNDTYIYLFKTTNVLNEENTYKGIVTITN